MSDNGIVDPVNPEGDSKLLNMIRAGEKIKAVKYYQTMTGLGLKESVDKIREIMGKMESSK